MKTNITKIISALFLFFMVSYTFAQVPQALNYQAVARTSAGALLANQAVGIKISIHTGSAAGAVVYSEIHAPTTNNFGLFTLSIGTETPVSGTFNTIDWSTGNYWLQVEMDPTGGVTYADMGTSQLLTVPYAMFAGNVGIKGDSNYIPKYAKTGGLKKSAFYEEDNYGYVGLGTINPKVKLHINGSARIDGLYPLLQFYYDTSYRAFIRSYGVNGDFYIANKTTSGNVILWTNNTERMRISSDGYVGIGVTPLQMLHVKQDDPNLGFRIEHNTTTDYWENGIGISTKNYKFYYNGTFRADISSTDGAYTQSSDRRLKKDIEEIAPVLSRVVLLKPYTYHYIDNAQDAPRSTGFIAQDVELLFPELVRETDDGYKGLVYDGFAVIAIKAIQELQAEIELLKLEIKALKENK
jgi:hypothetical protein